MEENKQQADGPYGSNQLFIFKAFIIFILGSLSLFLPQGSLNPWNFQSEETNKAVFDMLMRVIFGCT